MPGGMHELGVSRRTLHGTYDRDAAPLITIEPGDHVRLATLVSSWRLDREGRTFSPRDPERDRGHALTGPIGIRGVRRGDMLAIHVETVRPASWGESGAGGGAWGLNREMGLQDAPFLRMLWELDRDRGTATNSLGQSVRMAPFMGVMGMPADVPGLQPTRPPGINGGNIDCRELVAGSNLYLPVAVDGGLFSIGDGHAAQGDGEVGGIAIECSMERVELTFDVVPDPPIRSAYAKTPAGLITFGFDEDLDRAAAIALDAMLDLTVAQGLFPDRLHALSVATVVVDLRITQMVNQVRGVHALLASDAFVGTEAWRTHGGWRNGG